ncbi:flagellar protein FliT [Oceanobacillus locisalsi]|uniref:Flagellar protein FliT n=1 Tax=Oceanobacillus locisalsi TaxID=546107 RepID=A0ABW3NLP9_9BACI
MNRVFPIHQITENMQQLLMQEITSHNREEIIVELQEKIEKRGKLLESIAPPYSEEEEKLGRTVVHMNQHIEKQMQQLFTALKNEMKQVQQQKKSTTSYVNPYKSVQNTDGMFLDKKK